MDDATPDRPKDLQGGLTAAPVPAAATVSAAAAAGVAAAAAAAADPVLAAARQQGLGSAPGGARSVEEAAAVGVQAATSRKVRCLLPRSRGSGLGPSSRPLLHPGWVPSSLNPVTSGSLPRPEYGPAVLWLLCSGLQPHSARHLTSTIDWPMHILQQVKHVGATKYSYRRGMHQHEVVEG